VIVDGTDDWDAPMAVRPEQLVCQYEIQPLAWWHTGKSGQARSGVVLSDRDYAELRRRYAQEYGVDLESDPRFSAPGVARPECGCWNGEGIRVYPDTLSSLRR
jgi:hypothetical protein